MERNRITLVVGNQLRVSQVTQDAGDTQLLSSAPHIPGKLTVAPQGILSPPRTHGTGLITRTAAGDWRDTPYSVSVTSRTEMGCTKHDGLAAGGPEMNGCGPTGGHCQPLPKPLAATLAVHSQRFDEILTAVLDIKTTLEPKIDTVVIDMGHMQEDHKKLKEHVDATEFTMAALRPTVLHATSHIRALQREVAQLRQREHTVDDTLGADRALADSLLGGGPWVTPQSADEMI
ncbi:hypothetical protein NDU88_006981 [Pleurodeles waltl]|uniref:Uncharacterized protein n=1 Tax=Pleurodeles waltl TaxID=8319 RepID=A0AAV7TYP4_PLEWA|nr:hypothetical protein NDU88_006981 [Pleurodeles waltl]